MIDTPFKSNDGVQVVDSYWFNTIGLIKIRTETGELKYYIGQGKGHNQQEDEQIIATTGMPVAPKHLKLFFEW